MARRCKQCKAVELPPASKCTDFISKSGYCSIDCASKHQAAKQKAKREKEQKRANKAAKERLKTAKDLRKEAQPIFNAFVRLRDQDKPCITCGRMDWEIEDTHRS